MEYLIISICAVYGIARGINILKKGEARRWEVIPLFRIIGASILGNKKVHGSFSKVAGILHLGLGIICFIGLIFASSQ